MARATIVRFSSSAVLLLLVSGAACASTDDIPGGPTGFGGKGQSGAGGSAGKGGRAGSSGVGGSGATGGYGATGGTGGSGATGTGGTGGSGGVCNSDTDCAPYTNKRCDPSIKQCVFCLPSDDDCPAGQYCTLVKTCAPGCKNDDECRAAAGDSGGQACATARCDTSTRQCRGCCTDDDCPLGSICGQASADAGAASDAAPSDAAPAGDGAANENVCKPGCSPTHGCPTGKECCGDSTCHDVQTDVNNCGACGTKCPPPANATGGCVAGKCGLGTCNMGFGDCNMMASDGCEANLANSPQNCGACGTACNSTHGAASCNASKCVITCDAGWGNCDNNGSNGCETNLNSDATHCGGCTTRCGTFSSNTTCTNGTCELHCTGDWRDCDANHSNGCEKLAIDRNNCGDCNKVCNPAHVNGAVCNAPNCSFSSCVQGWMDCDGDKWNGCEKQGTSC